MNGFLEKFAKDFAASIISAYRKRGPTRFQKWGFTGDNALRLCVRAHSEKWVP